jgi:hypothetical protein
MTVPANYRVYRLCQYLLKELQQHVTHRSYVGALQVVFASVNIEGSACTKYQTWEMPITRACGKRTQSLP